MPDDRPNMKLYCKYCKTVSSRCHAITDDGIERIITPVYKEAIGVEEEAMCCMKCGSEVEWQEILNDRPVVDRPDYLLDDGCNPYINPDVAKPLKDYIEWLEEELSDVLDKTRDFRSANDLRFGFENVRR